tara:strand:+ start:185 stop:505 length:321 start_codon:yes stop_codon:yes gene_type:complete
MIMKMTGQAARDAAMAQIHDGTKATWNEAALNAVHQTARLHAEFIVDDVWDYLETDEEIEDKRAIGPIMMLAKREGWIKPTDRFQPSKVVGHHATPRRIWKSRILA